MASKVPVAHLYYEDLRRTASGFLNKFHASGSIPIPIEEIVDLKFGIDIIPTPGLHLSFDIDAFVTSDFSAMYVDKFVYESRPNRYRFSLTHELAHVILHREIFQQLSFSSIAEWVATVPGIPEDDYQWSAGSG